MGLITFTVLSLFWCSNCPRFDQWDILQAGLSSFWHVLIFLWALPCFLEQQVDWGSSITFPSSRLGISYFNKEKGISKPFCGEVRLRNQNLGARYTYCCFDAQALLVDNVGVWVYLHTVEFIFISISVCLDAMSSHRYIS